MTTIFSTSTVVPGPDCGTAINSERKYKPGIDPDELDPYSVWPLEGEGAHVHPWHDAKQTAARFEADQTEAMDELQPRCKDLGDDVDDPGQLSRFHQHRIAESAIADRLLKVAVPRARELQNYESADRLFKRATAMLSCRQRGPVGFNTRGNVVIAWEKKCGLAKYCPSESRKSAKLLADVYLSEIQEHRRRGGRVYKFWPTVYNYPVGRLREGIRYIPRKFRNRIMRSRENDKPMFPIDGALLIVEAPLSKRRDWNVHCNAIVLASGWLDFWKIRAKWGADIEMRLHEDFSDRGMAGLFNEMLKYPVIALPEKSSDEKHRNKAPPMVEWSGDELIEWDAAMHGYRRTRSYGSLYGLGKPDVTPAKVVRWLAYINHRPSGYVVTLRAHDLAMHRDMLLHSEHFYLDLVRGDNSTTKKRANRPRGPP